MMASKNLFRFSFFFNLGFPIEYNAVGRVRIFLINWSAPHQPSFGTKNLKLQ